MPLQFLNNLISLCLSVFEGQVLVYSFMWKGILQTSDAAQQIYHLLL